MTRIAGDVELGAKALPIALVFRTSIDHIAPPPELDAIVLDSARGPLGQLITSQRSGEVAPMIPGSVCVAHSRSMEVVDEHTD